METASENSRRIRAAIREIFNERPSVSNWCRMCRLVSDRVFAATQLYDDSFFDDECFLMGVGYLSLPPKRIPAGMVLCDDEWKKVNSYTDDEQETMNAAFGMLMYRLAHWAAVHDGDEPDASKSPMWELARNVWRFHEAAKGDSVSIFRTLFAQTLFRPRPFEIIAGIFPKKPIKPRLDVCYKAAEKGVDDVSEKYLAVMQAIQHGVAIMAGESLASGQARARTGKAGEIEQEDEIFRRVRANGDKGLRSFVAQVLRERDWLRSDGHQNTPEGRTRCYNRVYALMHPLRRSKSQKSHRAD